MPEPQADSPILRLLVMGGTPAHRGGLEAFCDRAVVALQTHAPGIAVHSLSTDTAYLSPGALLRVASNLLGLVRRRRCWDLVWLQVSNLPDLLYLAAARAVGLPVLVTPHFGANSRLQTRGWRRALCTALLGRADRIGVLFEGQEREIVLPPAVERAVVGTLLPRAAFSLACDRDELSAPLRLIHAARFSAEKGSFDVLALCEALRDRGVRFEARLIGRADDVTMAAIRRRIADAGLDEQIMLPGWLDETAMQEALREADVLVHLSSIDSFPLIVLEALAAGTLPLIRDMRGGRHMVEQLGGHVVDGGAAVQDACDWICGRSLEELRAEGARARARTHAAYAWPRITLQLEAAFSATLAARVKA